MKYNKTGFFRASQRSLVLAKTLIAKSKRISTEDFLKLVPTYLTEFKSVEYCEKEILNRLHRKGQILLVPSNRSLDGIHPSFTSYPLGTAVWCLPPKFQKIYEEADCINTDNYQSDPILKILETELQEALKITY